MHDEPWDTDSGNLLERFATEAEALTAVRGLIDLNGPSPTTYMALVVVGDHCRPTSVAAGQTLRELAEK